MPKVSAYVNGNTAIAVKDAVVKEVYESYWTGSLFLTKSEYLKHLKKVRSNIKEENRVKARSRRLSKLFELENFDEISKWITANSDLLWDNTRNWGEKKKNNPGFKVEITYLDLSYSDLVSNSHDCPHNGVTNFWSSRSSGVPTGYPGYYGRIEFKVSHEYSGFDLLLDTRIHTGTGGSSNGKNYGYDVRFFLADWPGLQKDVMLCKLVDKPVPPINFGTTKYFR